MIDWKKQHATSRSLRAKLFRDIRRISHAEARRIWHSSNQAAEDLIRDSTLYGIAVRKISVDPNGNIHDERINPMDIFL